MASVATFATPIVAALVGVVAFLQWRTAETKLRLDLYNRRFDILKRTIEFYWHVQSWKKPGEEGRAQQDEAHSSFIQAKIEAEFLFSKDHQVVETLQRIHDGVFRYVVAFKEEYAGPAGLTSFELYQRLEEHNGFVLSTMDAELKELRRAMAPYISFTGIGSLTLGRHRRKARL
jgi:hypothetical protein